MKLTPQKLMLYISLASYVSVKVIKIQTGRKYNFRIAAPTWFGGRGAKIRMWNTNSFSDSVIFSFK